MIRFQFSTRTALAILVAVFVSMPLIGNAQTLDREEVIQRLQDQIIALQAQLAALLEQQSNTDPSGASCMLYQNLARGDSGTEVTKLQQYLTKTGDYDYGYTTGYFGLVTETAVQRFQRRENIAGPGLPGYGKVGPLTRAELNAQMCSSIESPTNVSPTAAEIIEAVADEIRNHQSGFTLIDPNDPQLDFDVNGDYRVDLTDVIWVSNFSDRSATEQTQIRDAILAAVRNRFTGFNSLTRDHNLDVNNDRAIDLSDLTLIRNVLVVEGAEGPSINLLSPTGEKEYLVGDTVPVDWDYTGDYNDGTTVTVRLLNKHQGLEDTLVTGRPASKGFLWEIPENYVEAGVSAAYRIEIICYNNGNVVCSDLGDIFSVSGDELSQEESDGTLGVSLVSTAIQINSDNRLYAQIHFDVTARDGDVLLNKDQHAARLIQNGDQLGSITSNFDFSGDDDSAGRLIIREGETERVTISAVAEITEESVYQIEFEFLGKEYVTREVTFGSTVTLTRPADGYVIQQGEILDIVWNSTDADGSWSVYSSLLTSQGSVLKYRWGRSSNDGSWRGTIKDDVDPGEYKVRIELVDGDGKVRASDESGVFTVSPTGTEIIEAVTDEVRDNQTGFTLIDTTDPRLDFDVNGDYSVDLTDVIWVRDFKSQSASRQELIREKIEGAVRNRYTGFSGLSEPHNLDVNNDKAIDLSDLIIIRNALGGGSVQGASTSIYEEIGKTLQEIHDALDEL
ncbi:MAG: peptidoglycan-binding protein [Candidatus Paceibacterota bacterium]